MAGYISLFFLVLNGFQKRGQISLLIKGVIGLGVFETLYGLVQQIGGHAFVWMIPARHGGAQGTLMNHCHYALLLNISICVAVGFLYQQAIEMLRGQNLSLRSIFSISESPKLFFILIWIGFIGVGVFASLSRTGIFAMFASLGSMLIAIRLVEKRKHAVLLIVFVLLAIVALGIYTGVDAAIERYADLVRTGHSEEGRLKVWRDAWPMIGKSMFFGAGLGSFQWAFPAYETLDPDIPAMYAHNDYLQLLTEAGIVGLGLVVWIFTICWRSAIHNLRSRDALARGIGLATIGALVATATQEITDYSLCIPGVAALFLLQIGLNERVRWSEKEDNAKSRGTISIPVP
jgi:O-antigen ligase